MSTSSWRDVAAKREGSYKERTCLRCFEGRVYDVARGGMRAVLGHFFARVLVYPLYPELKDRPR